MRNSAYRYAADYPTEEEPVFPLQRPGQVSQAPGSSPRRYPSDPESLVAAAPTVSRPPLSSEPPAYSGVYQMDDEPVYQTDDEPLPGPRRKARSIAARILGALVIAAAFYICGALLTNPQAGRAVLGWVTMGHAEQVTSLAARAVGALRALTGG